MRHPLIRLLVWLVVLPALCGCAMPDGAPREMIAPERDVVLPSHRCADFFIVDAYVNGRGPCSLLVDTGAQLTVLDPRVAEGLPRERAWLPAYAVGAEGKSERVRLTHVDSLRMGELELRSLGAFVMNMQPFSDAMGERLDGVLGFGALRDLTLTIDFSASQVRVSRDVLPAPYGPDVLRMTVPSPMITIGVAGRKEQVLIDSGSSGILALESLRGLSLVAPPRPTDRKRAVGGAATRRVARLDGSVTIAQAEVNRPLLEETAGTPRIGTGLLRYFTVSLDQRSRRARLARPAVAPADTATEVRGIGVGFDREGGVWRVVEVYPDTPGASAGLLPGDVVIAIDGTPVDRFGCGQYRDLLEGRERVTLDIHRGGETLRVPVDVAVLVP